MRRTPLFVSIAALAVLVSACGDDKAPEKPSSPAEVSPPYGGRPPYGAGSPGAGGAATGLDAATEKRVDDALAKARTFLLSRQNDDGSFGDPEIGETSNLGFSAMATAAVIAATPREKVAGDPQIAKALDFLAKHQKDDGAIYDEKTQGLSNYVTSAAVGAFTTAKSQKHVGVVGKAKAFLQASQFQENSEDLNYGAFPYSSKTDRPADLSNVQFAAQALADAELPKGDPTWQRIRTFLDKVQNHSETNKVRVERDDVDGDPATKETVVSGNDGGSAYAPGLSYAGWEKNPDGTWSPRSYGSMTYALLKCLLLAGVDVKDPRVTAAVAWIARNFAVDRNPGMEKAKPATEGQDPGQQGYNYFLYTAARTLAEYERIAQARLPVSDAQGKAHDWRKELAEAILRRQGADGSWAGNPADRWEEGSRVLVTSYLVTALAAIRGRI